jgi:hypothetical protein
MKFSQFILYFATAWIVAMIPLFVLNSIPGVDSMNHAARIHVLAHLDEGYRQFYSPHWVLLPNLGMDLLLVPLAKFLPVLPLIKGFIGLIIGLIGFGFAWLNRELSGKWSAWGLVGLLFAYNFVLGFGFLNYLFGIGIALILLAWQVRHPHHRWWLVLVCPLLFVVHLMALGLFLVTLLLIWINQEHTLRKRDYLPLLVGCVVCLGLLAGSATGSSGHVINFDPIITKLTRLIFPLEFGSRFDDIGTQVLGLGLLVWFRKYFTVEKQVYWVGGTLVGITLLAPNQMFTSAFIAARLPLWVWLVSLAHVQSRPNLSDVKEKESKGYSRSQIIVYSAFLMFVNLRLSGFNSAFREQNKVHTQLMADLDQIPAGSILFHIAHATAHPSNTETWNPSLIHADCELLLKKPLYVENLFTYKAQQPILPSPWVGQRRNHEYARYPYAQEVAKELERCRVQMDSMSPELRVRPAYLYFLKPLKPEITPPCPELIIDRPKYALFRVK